MAPRLVRADRKVRRVFFRILRRRRRRTRRRKSSERRETAWGRRSEQNYKIFHLSFRFVSAKKKKTKNKREKFLTFAFTCRSRPRFFVSFVFRRLFVCIFDCCQFWESSAGKTKSLAPVCCVVRRSGCQRAEQCTLLLSR